VKVFGKNFKEHDMINLTPQIPQPVVRTSVFALSLANLVYRAIE
jgi:hypothetical protein